MPRLRIEPLTVEHFGFYSLGAALLAGAYGLAFVHGGMGLGAAFVNTFYSVGAAYALGLPVCALTARLLRTPWPFQFTCHVFLAGAFSWGWYALIRLSFGLTNWPVSGQFTIQGFPRSVLTWQLCQGLVVYALLVCATLALIFHGRQATVDEREVQPDPSRRNFNRFLTRRGDMIEPVAVEEIILILGAGDYSQVVTRRGQHLVRMLLGDLEDRLDSNRFMRVHRSKIINLEHMISVEPGGKGQMIVHLTGGTTVTVSRSGAQRLRELLI